MKMTCKIPPLMYMAERAATYFFELLKKILPLISILAVVACGGGSDSTSNSPQTDIYTPANTSESIEDTADDAVVDAIVDSPAEDDATQIAAGAPPATATEIPVTALDDISTVLSTLKKHLTGEVVLTDSQIAEQVVLLQQNAVYLNANETVIKDAFEVVDYFESTQGALFVSDKTKKGFNRSTTSGDDFSLERAMFSLQQAVHDYIFTATSVETYQLLLNGKQFKTAAYFPGAAPPPSSTDTTYEVPVNGTLPAYWGKPVSYASDPARRPTGLYLAAGSVGAVTVPASMINKGFFIQVGAHSWDKTVKTLINRFDRVTNAFPITSEVTHIANPFGGGIYIVVPYLADAGVVKIQVSNVIKSPFFSLTSTNKMTLDDWKIQRANPAPWADFESDRFMMQVPRSWIYAYEDPVTLMQNWDKAMDGVSEFLGYPTDRNRTVLYLQVDISLAHSAYGIGYPMVNHLYDPYKVESGNKNSTLLTDPLGWAIIYHELGHAQLFSRFSGETEAIVNFPYVYVSNVKFNHDMNTAFQASGYSPFMSRDQAAIDWMVTENFRNDKPMDKSNTTKDEFRYQSRGYAKYMDVALLFGWEALTGFYTQEQLDYINGTPANGLGADDSRILMLSKSAGVDLTPLIYFWGVHPQDSAALKAKITAAGLPKSKEIYDLIVYYKSIAPQNNAEFRAQQESLYPTLPAGGNADYGYGWYNVWADIFNESHGEAIQTELQKIIDMYELDKE